jgi:hypothetical protein
MRGGIPLNPKLLYIVVFKYDDTLSFLSTGKNTSVVVRSSLLHAEEKAIMNHGTIRRYTLS